MNDDILRTKLLFLLEATNQQNKVLHLVKEDLLHNQLTSFIESTEHFRRIYTIRVSRLVELNVPILSTEGFLDRIATWERPTLRLIGVSTEESTLTVFTDEEVSQVVGILLVPKLHSQKMSL